MMSSKPTIADWGTPTDDLDDQYARRMFMGVSESDAIARFAENPVGRSEDLLHMPTKVLPFYLNAFAKYLLRLKPPTLDAADAVSCFISVCEVRASDLRDQIQDGLIREALDRVMTGQDFYDAPEEIYGSFKARVSAVWHLTQHKNEHKNDKK